MNLSFHFNIEVDSDRKLAIAKIYGIWKKETALEYQDEYQEQVKPLLKNTWARLTNLTNWKSSYPDIIEVLGEHMDWCHHNGAVYSVYVIDNPITTRQLKAMIAGGHIDDTAKIFSSYNEADKFLKKNGF